MSDVYQTEINPDDEPGTRLQEALRAADVTSGNAGLIPRGGDRRGDDRRTGERREREPKPQQ